MNNGCFKTYDIHLTIIYFRFMLTSFQWTTQTIPLYSSILSSLFCFYVIYSRIHFIITWYNPFIFYFYNVFNSNQKKICFSCKNTWNIFTNKNNQHSSFTFISILFYAEFKHITPELQIFCFFGFFWDSFFFCATSSFGLGTICFFQ